MNEFDLIERLKPLSEGRAEAGGFRNDAAVLSVPDGYELVVTSDCTTAGVHFLEGQSPGTIAQKALRRNLSDLNAMGATPYCYQMCLLLPALEERWLQGFIDGLAEDQKRYGVFLSGGDVSSTPGPLSVVITAFGLVETGKAFTRSGAQAGDLAVVSGPVGDAVCGLKALREGLEEPELAAAYQTPEVRMYEGLPARAAIDISDGLAQDLGHICTQSGLTAVVRLEDIPLSVPVCRWLSEGRVTYADILSGGDDYRLLLAVPPGEGEALLKAHPEFSVIGMFQDGPGGVQVLHNGAPLPLKKTGWNHFG
jgi:thiamine-monophosphate kinase